MKFSLNIIILAIFLLPNIAVSQLSPDQHAKIQAYVERIVLEQRMPGFSMTLVYNGFDTFFTSGKRDVEQDLPVTPDTLFVLGSNSKLFTATLISLYYEQMGYSLDTPINQIAPGLVVFIDRYRTEHMSMADLLSHMYCIDSNVIPGYCGAYATDEEFIRRIRFYGPWCELRDIFIYNNLDIALAGHILGLMTGKGYAEELRTRLLLPLGLNNSYAGPDAMARYPETEVAYSYNNNGTHYLPISLDVVGHSATFAPSGTIVSSARDMAKWMKFHLNLGQTSTGEQLISEAAVRRIQTAQALSVTPYEGFQPFGPLNLHYAYGFGLSVGTRKGYKHLQHGGSYACYNSDIGMFPGLQLGMFTVSNGPCLGEGGAQYALQDYVLDLIIGDAFKSAMQPPRKPTEDKLNPLNSGYTHTHVSDTKAAVNNSIYVGSYGHFLMGNATVYETEDQVLRLQYGTECAGWLEYVDGITFLGHYEDITWGLVTKVPIPIVFTVPEGGGPAVRLLITFGGYFEFIRDLKLSDAPAKPWDESSC